MKNNPKVGIVIPSYNRLEYLKESVESAVKQTYKNLEILIIDDNSPNPAIKKYLKKIKNPKVNYLINKTNLGVVKNFNKGIGLLNKDVKWVVILGNDDYLDKDFIKEAVSAHLKYPGAKVIACRQILVNANKEKIEEDKGFPAWETAENYLCLRCLGHRKIRSTAIFFNLKQFEKVGGYPIFPSGMCTDNVFIFSLTFDNLLAFSKKAFVYIRIHEGAESSTTNNLLKKLVSIKQMHAYCLNVYKDKGVNKQKNKQKVMAHVEYYIQLLNLILLRKKYKEVVSQKSKSLAKKTFKKIVKQCKKNKIEIPFRFSILIYFFSYLEKRLEQIYLYIYFVSYLAKWDLLKLSIKSFLSNKTSFIKNIKQYIKKIPGAITIHKFINEQLNIVSKASEKSWLISGFNYCHCCGHYSLFYWDNKYENLLENLVPKWNLGNAYAERMVKRENEFCGHCRSVFRTRAHAKTILNTFNQSRLSAFLDYLKKNTGFNVYETANYRSFRHEKLRKFKNYQVSEFHSDHGFGKEISGVRNENLEHLTFADESFDLLITAEVLEHVSSLPKSLTEIHRVLKPGGYHIFTVPVNYSMKKTRLRAKKKKNGKIQYLLPPAIHGDDISDGVLVYRDFGANIKKIMKKYGFRCQEDKYYINRKHIASVYIAQKLN